MQALQLPGWPKPKGYSNGIVAKGRLVFVAGQVGWNAQEKFETSDLTSQARQALKNIVAILAEAGAGPEHICRMDWFLADVKEYNAGLKELGAAYSEGIGKHYPVMTAVQVGGFVETGAKLGIECTRVLPG